MTATARLKGRFVWLRASSAQRVGELPKGQRRRPVHLAAAESGQLVKETVVETPLDVTTASVPEPPAFIAGTSIPVSCAVSPGFKIPGSKLSGEI